MTRLSIRDDLIGRLQARARQPGVSLDDALALLLDHVEVQPQDYLRLLAERSPDTALIFDVPSRRIEYINHPTFLGYTADLLQQPNLLLNILHQADRSAVFLYWQALMSEPSDALLTIDYRLRDQEGDPGRYYRSAIRFAPPGSHIAARTGLDGASMVAEIKDSGIGIGAEHLPRIFERFYGSIAPHHAGAGAGDCSQDCQRSWRHDRSGQRAWRGQHLPGLVPAASDDGVRVSSWVLCLVDFSITETQDTFLIFVSPKLIDTCLVWA